MQLSPFDQQPNDNWPYDAPLYGRPGPRDPQGRCTFELFPVRPDEDTSDLSRIPRDSDEYDPNEIGFDIPEANAGTDYVLVTVTFDRPRLQWYSREQFKNRFFYDPLNPPRPQGVDPNTWEDYAEDRVRGEIEPTVHLNQDTKALIERIAQLWNGCEVCNVHLLADQCPTMYQLTADLDEDCLKRLYYNADLGKELLLAFGDADWFETTTSFLKSTTVFRKQVWYDLNHKARIFLNERDDMPDLRGDPYEGLVHRLTVGLVCLRNQIRGRETDSYYDWRGYTIDAIAKDQHGQGYAYEVLTEHNNWKLYRETYRKIEELHRRGVRPIAVFDSRETAYEVFNHWHRQGLAELPNGTFNSDYSIAEGNNTIERAYHSDEHNWVIPEWTTTWKLKEETLGSDGPELSREQLVSLDW